ncbi:FtsX-like permease family protein [Priestia megaterium]|uniref:FtsX-like permease family protein n=1 Tax=Priestia megaterium TaxID=1404 RepID=UPI002452EF1F|nr:FtsX-like permease family protein [Priestia megaterium]MDH3142427.1 hypothetical protein [Priestia megaterium]MED4235779.1 hypothetical protein [Priestia megaterium]MED4255155.1 hypothetical protein [Priestia megaterium]MED4265498.1 hypothetical protein [Priestia megaterium]MED4274822.1 hypothetical protein [Priestia megaterium]
MFYQRWGIFIVVIATLVVSTMVGVFNSLANNIYSKRKEFAVLRAMGMTPKSIRKVILSQVNLYITISNMWNCNGAFSDINSAINGSREVCYRL